MRAIHDRLKPGAPFVAAHMSFPQAVGRDAWLDRYAGYAIASGIDSDIARGARAAVAANLKRVDPEQDEEIMRAGGFSEISLFYAAFTWRGWVAYA